MATYEVDLYGKWERRGDEAQSFITYILGRGCYLLGFEFVSAEVTRQDHEYPWWVTKEYGTVHVRLDVQANTTAEALKKAKNKVTRWLKEHTCSPPKVTWL